MIPSCSHHTPTRPSSQYRLPAGTPQALTTLDSQNEENEHYSPQVLPGGKSVLFTVDSAAGPQIVVQSLETGQRRVVLQGADEARYVPTGHLVYVQAGTLMAVAFDLGAAGSDECTHPDPFRASCRQPVL